MLKPVPLRLLLADAFAAACVVALVSTWCLAVIGFFARGM